MAQKRTLYAGLLLLLLLAFLAGLFFANLRAAARVGGGEDLLVPWNASRAFLLERRNPYEDSVARETQILLYGHPARETEYPYRLDIPFFLLLFFFPFAAFKDFLLARALWLTLAELALAAALFLNLRLANWRPPRSYLVLLVLFTLLGAYSLYALSVSAASIFLALLFSAAILAIREKRDMLAGILLALTLIKWEMTLAFLLFVFLWLASHRRRQSFLTFGMTLFVLAASSEILKPGWFFPFLRSVLINLRARYYHGITFFSVFAKTSLHRPLLWTRIFVGFFVLILLLEGYAALGKGFRRFLWVAALTLTLPPFFNIPVTPADYPLLFLPLVLALSVAASRWRRLGFWGGILALLLLWFPLLPHAFSSDALDALFLPLPLFLLISLYWVRWWAIQPPRVLADEFPELRLK